MTFIFAAILTILALVWGGNLLILLLLGKLFGKDASGNGDGEPPHVTVLLTVKNEEALIAKRLENLLLSDYPDDRIEIIVASDGSTDMTDQIVEDMSAKHAAIRLIRVHQGGGKSCAQNEVINDARGEIIILTDAEASFERDTVRNLAMAFADPVVGCATGTLLLAKCGNNLSECHGIYWRFETALRRAESRLGLLHTASGAVMAFRKELHKPFESCYGDDCIIPLNVLCQGKRVAYVEDAVAYDTFPSTVEGEIKARARMTLRNITCTLSKPELLNPLTHPLLSFTILTHKIFRWLTPVLLALLLLANILLSINGSGLYIALLIAQILFYLLAGIGIAADRRGIRVPLASQAGSFIIANYGFALGLLKALSNMRMTSYK